MNAPLRRLANTHLTHRDEVLSAIGEKHSTLNSSIDHSRALAVMFRDRLRSFAEDMPEDTVSRLNWMSQQLANKGI